MFKLSILLVLIINFSSSALAEEVSNSINAVNYFSGRSLELEDLRRNLVYYKKASIVGISGIGKTQLIRTYVQNSNYKLVWFFDCKRDLNAQYLNLAKHINQTIEDKNLALDEDYVGIKERILDYLKPKEKWLLVYDNLKLGQNDLIKDIIGLEANGDIIIASQDGTGLPYAIYLQPLEEAESLEVINKILPNNKHADYLSSSFKGYPLLLVKGAMLLKTDSYLSQDYKQLLLKQESSIKSYIKLLMASLSSSEKDILYKISVINYQNFSKNFLQKIINYPDKFEQDIHHIMQLGLVISVGSNKDNEIFEMHETIKEQIVSSANTRLIKDITNEAINKATKMIPISSAARYLAFVNDQTIVYCFEKLLLNAELYKISKNQIINLREKLLSFYTLQRDFTKCEKMKEWLLNNKNNYWQLWLMNEQEKLIYASYLNYLSMYEEWSNTDPITAIILKNQAKDILMTLTNNYEHKFSLLIQLAQSYITVRNTNEAIKNLVLAQQYIQNDLEKKTMEFIKARILFSQEKFNEALEVVNNITGLNNKDLPLNSLTAPVFGLKAKILNHLNCVHEAHNILSNLYIFVQKEQQYDVLISNLIELSQTLLALKDPNTAYKHIIRAKNLVLNRGKVREYNYSISQNYHFSSILKTEADCLSALGNYQQAIVSYVQAEAIFYNLYRENIKNNPMLSSLYFNGANAACKLKDRFWFNKFKRGHLTIFGIDHLKSIELQSMQCF